MTPEATSPASLLISGEIVSKRIALLNDLLPGAKMLAVLMSTAHAHSVRPKSAVAERVAHTLGWQVKVLKVGDERDFEAAFQPLARERADALLVTTDPVFESQRDRSLRSRPPRHTGNLCFARVCPAGGLMTMARALPMSIGKPACMLVEFSTVKRPLTFR